MAPPFSFIPTLPTGPQPGDHSRAFYEYAPAPTLTLPHNMAQLSSGNPNAAAVAAAAVAAANGHHRLANDQAAAAYAISSQFGREPLIQRNTLQPFVSSLKYGNMMQIEYIIVNFLYY